MRRAVLIGIRQLMFGDNICLSNSKTEGTSREFSVFLWIGSIRNGSKQVGGDLRNYDVFGSSS